MLEDSNISVPPGLASQRAVYQALAERFGVLTPGETLSDELMAFADEVACMARAECDSGRGAE